MISIFGQNLMENAIVFIFALNKICYGNIVLNFSNFRFDLKKLKNIFYCLLQTFFMIANLLFCIFLVHTNAFSGRFIVFINAYSASF